MYQGKKVLAVIPARKGSQRFPDKNLSKIDGKTLVELAISTAQCCDHIIVTSDDERTYTPLIELHSALWLKRPETLSQGEKGSSLRTWKHAFEEAEKQYGKIEYSVLLEPTSPNRTVKDVEKCISQLSHYPSVATVTKEPKLFYSYNGVKRLYGNFFKMNGICYAANRGAVMNQTLFDCCQPLVIDRPVANIDYPEDLDLARFFF